MEGFGRLTEPSFRLPRAPVWAFSVKQCLISLLGDEELGPVFL
jgi:hypothetical protein